VPDDAFTRPTIARYRVLGGLCAAAAIAYFARQLISVVAGPLASELSLDERQIGSIMASFFVGYALFQIPSGWLADRWGSRRCLALVATVWSLATAAMSLAGGYASLIAIWFAVGSAQAGVFPCAAASIRVWLPSSRRAFASGMLASCMSLGGALSSFVAGMLIAPLGWRALFVLFALPGLAWALIFGWWFRNTPEEHAAVNSAERALISEGRPIGAAVRVQGSAPENIWATMLSSRSMWAICGQQFFRAAAYIFFATWFPTYLTESRGVSLATAGQLTSLPLVAVVLGSPVGGVISDALWTRTRNVRLSRCALAAVGMALCAGLILAAYFVESAPAAVAVISLGAFCAALGGVSAYTITMDLGGRHVGTVFSVMNMCGNVGAALFPSFVGWLVSETGRWNEILLLFAAIYVAAAVCWMLVDPRRAIFSQDDASTEFHSRSVS
jgi:sugar phosphate permease